MSEPLFLGDPQAVLAADVGSALALDGPEGHHAVGALRMRVGERLLIGDGAGRVLTCQVESVLGRHGLIVRVLAAATTQPPDVEVTVVQALPKGERGELAVELLTEVGVDVIVPWQAARCVTRWSQDRAVRGVNRWRAVAVAAGKQSRRPRLPLVAEPASAGAVARLVAAADLALVLHEEATERMAGIPVPAVGRIVLVVGPEGGLTQDEVASLAAAGGSSVRMGPEVLRTSSAGALAAALVMAGCGRW